MNGLQGSLPLSSKRRTALLQPFRDSAYNLTAFFKTASAEVDRAFADGARSALEQLLAGMDRENLGLQEGEGWRVRQMVMDLYQGLQADEGDVSEDGLPEPEEEDKASEGSSPVRQTATRMTMPTKVATAPLHQTIAEDSEEDEKNQSETIAEQNTPSKSRRQSKSVQWPPLFGSFTQSASPTERLRTPTAIPTRIDFSDAHAMTFFGAMKSKAPVLGSGAGTKRRSKSPNDSPTTTTPPLPKRVRRNGMEH